MSLNLKNSFNLRHAGILSGKKSGRKFPKHFWLVASLHPNEQYQVRSPLCRTKKEAKEKISAGCQIIKLVVVRPKKKKSPSRKSKKKILKKANPRRKIKAKRKPRLRKC